MSRLAPSPLLAFLFRLLVTSSVCGGGMAAASLAAAAGEAFTSEAAIRRAERRDDMLRTSLRTASLDGRVGEAGWSAVQKQSANRTCEYPRIAYSLKR